MKQELTITTEKLRNFSGEIAIVTCCMDDWGGSEELWARSLPYLIEEGNTITVYKENINPGHPEYVKLTALGVKLQNIEPTLHSLPIRVGKKISRKILPSAFKYNADSSQEVFYNKLKENKPRLVIINQGINFDGVHFAKVCIDLGIRYVMVAQKAVDFYWPYFKERALVIDAYRHAVQSIFVSRHNLRLTEEQLGMRLKNAAVVFNPVKFSRSIIPYPSIEKGFKLACVGRYFILDKGQDILIRIFSGERWRNRPVTISFIGAGNDKQSLIELAQLLNVTNVHFLDYSTNMENVWKEHHALVLPSRSEGMPLVMLEAMSAGRMVVVSNAGGNTEIVEEGVNGFIGAPYEDSFEKALEDAWTRREEWKRLGENASSFIKERVPACPELEFANHLKRTIHG
ncbi:glycosyltransferase family 4 protein [Pollutibacter soli]|uniref:glycosyltransferase family 4 protein n=1 Tax=Pollutibacter soli TaxID=3034157 RepID=UPI003013E8AA